MTQTPLTLIDVANWIPDDFFATYPEGARDKRAFFPPPGHGLSYINDSRRYMFKYSDKRYPEQYWSEIVACAIGSLLGLDPSLRAPMVNCVNALDLGKLSKFLDECVAINCYVPLSRWRADFMLRLIKRRQEILVEVFS